MTESLFVPVIGKLVRTTKTIYVPQVEGLSLQEWVGETVTIPFNTPLMFLDVSKGCNKSNPYWKTYLLFGEQIVFYSSYEDEFGHVFEYVE